MAVELEERGAREAMPALREAREALMRAAEALQPKPLEWAWLEALHVAQEVEDLIATLGDEEGVL
jgi:hypothetical protein